VRLPIDLVGLPEIDLFDLVDTAGLGGRPDILIGLDARGLMLGPSLVLVGIVVRTGERPMAVGADWRGLVGELDRALGGPGREAGCGPGRGTELWLAGCGPGGESVTF